MSVVKVFLNKKEVEARTEETILDVAKRNGISIPTLCHDGRLEPYGACRVCLVKVDGARSLVPSCSTTVADGMKIDTESPDILKARRMSLSLLVSDHFGDCVSPCSTECPAHIDIQGYIALVACGMYTEAVKLIKEKNPLPLCIGRICPHPCETVCRRNKVDEPIAINNLKRFAADRDAADGGPYVPKKAPSKNRRVAVIGSGPAGLSCAYYLCVMGYDVTVFEKEKKAGGMLRWGIPEYRLPKRILDSEVSSITGLGVKIEYGRELGRDLTVERLKEEYDAVFLGTGAGMSTSMRVAGEDLPGVESGLDFLYRVAAGDPEDISKKTVVVVGGGNTAMDAARTAVRLGASSVNVLYRRTRAQMPANEIEIEEAIEEKIRFEFLNAPVKITTKDGSLTVECVKMELGEPDSSGRRRPVPIEGSNHTIVTDVLITAIGQRPFVPFLGEELVTAKDTVNADPKTGVTSDGFLFAAGDCVTGAATAIEAVAGGRSAALSIDAVFNGQEPSVSSEFNIKRGTLEELPEELFALYDRKKRAVMPTVAAGPRKNGFEEIEKGLSEEEARSEAARCLECGCAECFSCSLRDFSTEYGVSPDEWEGQKNVTLGKDRLAAFLPPIMKDYNKCIKCGTCIRVCDEIWGLSIYGFVERGFKTEVSPYFGLDLARTACDFCGGCADSCPTGALSLRPFPKKPGPFKTERKKARCAGCSLGCELEYHIYGNSLVKVTAVETKGENEGWLCVRGRFGYRHLLPESRATDFMEIKGKEKRLLSEAEAVEKASAILSSPGRTGILTSTSLSNEEYAALKELGGAAGADVFHVPFDYAEEAQETLYPLYRSPEVKALFAAALNASMEDIENAPCIVLWDILPGRSYPVLEMKIRRAVRSGSRLFIINSVPTRLDEAAQKVFRVPSRLYCDLLDLLRTLISSRNSGGTPPDPRILYEAGLTGDGIASFIRTVRSSSASVWVTDEYGKNIPETTAWLKLLSQANDGQKNLCKQIVMNRGANPEGAFRYGASAKTGRTLTEKGLCEFETLLFYKLPVFFDLETANVIRIGFEQPRLVGGRAGGNQTIFIPASSILETGGTTVLYSKEEMVHVPVLEHDKKIDQPAMLRTIVERVCNVRKNTSFDSG
ncbi:MAG: FAD-dependent oxidoreductase [Spirochaetes bacterium]|nr:FAD-dependent oxidoreductase [Spirochaetota bacterium]